MRRPLVWLQLLLGWLPMWALVVTLMVTMHPDVTVRSAALIALRLIVCAALLALFVHRFTMRVPWPHPFRVSFLAIHVAGALAYAMAWLVLDSALESVIHGRTIVAVGPGVTPFLVLGVWFYVMVAGVSYGTAATERVARAEALAARSQLAALRAQLNPHFLFNALHTVVQLIPREPRRAGQAAEQLAALLRTTIEEDRDLVSLAEEWAFVERYVELERVRFGDRLRVNVDMTDDARGALIPSFALQTLVENAVRHGATPREEATDVVVSASTANGNLMVTVSDTGAGATPERIDNGNGTGLKRLRERLSTLYANRARLDVVGATSGGVTASLVIPLEASD